MSKTTVSSSDCQLLVIGDPHGELHALGAVLAGAESSGEPYDAVLCTGDLGTDLVALGTSSVTSAIYRKSAACVLESIGLLGIPGFFVPGNHDLPDIGNSDGTTSVDVLQGCTAKEVKGWRIAGVGGSPPTPARLPYEWGEEEAEPTLRRLIELRPDVLLLHSPPQAAGADLSFCTSELSLCKSTDGNIRYEHVGSMVLRRIIEEAKPRLAVCGHIHEGFGCEILGETVLVNAGCLYDVREIIGSGGHESREGLYQYFSIVLSADRSVTVVNFMFIPARRQLVRPLAWHVDGSSIRRIGVPQDEARRAWKFINRA